MTDPNGPATELGTIYVVGQRRAPGGSFPQRGGGGGGGGSGEDGIHQNQVSQDEPPPPYVQDPCADPSLAREWNTDAAAAEAKAKFLAKAAELGDEELYQREFHAFLYRDSNGRVQVGGVTAGNRVGSTEPSTVGADWTGITPDNIIGEIHNHPGGSVAPGGDWERFDGITSWITQFAGSQRASEYRHYIIASDTIRVYDATSPRNDDPGPEVNPQGQPCP